MGSHKRFHCLDPDAIIMWVGFTLVFAGQVAIAIILW